MSTLLKDIAQLWQTKFWFILATSYLLVLFVLVLLLDWLPLNYSPNYLDLANTASSPSESFNIASGHWAGTDALGRDVLSNTLHGARTGLSIAIPVMLFSCLLGVIIGAWAGYFGNKGIKFSIGQVVVALFTGLVVYFYGLYIPLKALTLNLEPRFTVYSLLVVVIVAGFLRLVLLPVLLRLPVFRANLYFPLDRLVLHTIEILTSVPKLILILALASFITPSVTILSVILALTYWTGIARLTRAEMLRIKQLPFIEAAHSLGMTQRNILWKEALPNLLGPVVVAFTFGVAGLLAVESTLSFLGIGLPATTPSWGRLIAGIRSDTSAWWLVVIPGSVLTLTVLALQVCSHYLLSSLQDKSKA